MHSYFSNTRRNQARRAPGGWRKKKKIDPRYRYGKIPSGANPNTDRRRKPLPRKPGPRSAHRLIFLTSAGLESCWSGVLLNDNIYMLCVGPRIVAAIQKRSESDR